MNWGNESVEKVAYAGGYTMPHEYAKAVLSVIADLPEIARLMARLNAAENGHPQIKEALAEKDRRLIDMKDALNYWLPVDEPNPHCTDKVSKFHQQKWLEACRLLQEVMS